MTTYSHTATAGQNRLLTVDSLRFRRKNNGRKAPRRLSRKKRIRSRHILLLFLAFAVLFVLIQRSYLFLLTWDHLDVRTVEVECGNPALAARIQETLERRYLGNILLLDIQNLRSLIRRNPLVKEVFIRKMFPAALHMEVVQRIPAAYLDKTGIYLIDREGVVIEKTDRSNMGDFPLLTDSGNFKRDMDVKLALAWKCLDDLNPEEKQTVAVLDFSRRGEVSVYCRNGEEEIRLDADSFASQFRFYLLHRDMFHTFGRLRTVDMRFPDRVYLRPTSGTNGHESPKNGREE
ncbi:MAG: FtsQ-type POTRA domain-containing protein [Acidobacteria bacterium]|nr:FtsQ-type POTRA domain-containing protein [Acidobacteriota bacterium]MBU4254716.1 FtsQ-type POTRA domain-containing protein [Acidobacteriota bacterium]MBU4331206.1 FtsQ-type POTRA domain-containing protein [Acidobacteriota bacterium]MCG2816004.1 FtsQ-type POTRA domain-containing protein [Candidatus Aminicenantes bacterium]